MPNLQTSIKDLRQSQKRQEHNDRLRNRTKRSIKKFNTLVAEENKEEAGKTLPTVFKTLDKASKKNVIKEKKADRIKSRLTKKLNKLAQNNVKSSKKSA
jgi:small subunit ribosomal protein S20